MTVSEELDIKSRVASLEAEVARLKKQVERGEITAGIQRGRDEADRGLMIPARELVASLRAKYNLPTT